MKYKKPRTYEKGYLEVGNKHKIYYELCGNPNGKPILFVHGGPGGGFRQKDKLFFNPKKFKIIMFDQRGSGKSTPFASLKHNTTKHLISDMKKLLTHLKIKKTILFGGSWGSTLSIAYAIKHPKTVSGMILRGIFLGTEREDNYFVYGAKNIYPEAWGKFASLVPKKYIKNKKIIKYYYKMVKSKNPKIRKKFAYAWANYEFSISSLKYSKEKIKKIFKVIKYEAFGPIEIHYMANQWFMPKNFIPKNLHKISHIPTSIIHGRYDIICSPLSAYTLHKNIKKSKLHFTIGGHASSDKETKNLLIKETNRIGQLAKT